MAALFPVHSWVDLLIRRFASRHLPEGPYLRVLNALCAVSILATARTNLRVQQVGTEYTSSWPALGVVLEHRR